MAPRKREVLMMFELEGLPAREIGERLGCPENTVFTRLHHARREFKAIARKLGLDVDGDAGVRSRCDADVDVDGGTR